MAEYHIKIEGFAYNPGEQEIKPGDKITWTNLDTGAVHTATSSTGAPVAFDTGDLGDSDSASHTFDDVAAGTEIPYECTHHSFMVGRIKVT